MYRVVRRLCQVGAVAAVTLALGACDHPWIEKQRIALGGWTQERMLADGWLKAPPPRPVPVRCRETLGDPDCHLIRARRKPTPPAMKKTASAEPAKAPSAASAAAPAKDK